MRDTATHPAFYSDHGVVHVRDVAKQILRVLQVINGVLIPQRSAQQMESFLYGYGVALAYLHDIGMSDLSPFGRAMHPEFAAQSVFDDPLDDVVQTMWDDNCSNIAWQLAQLFKSRVLKSWEMGLRLFHLAVINPSPLPRGCRWALQA
jgi:metal-dependent HD superfamily phosphatase/phosphodiesterase